MEKKKTVADLNVVIDDKAVDQHIEILKEFTKPFNTAREKLINKAVNQPEQLSFLPTQLCRSTIFHPLPRKGRKVLQADPLKLEFKTDWGTIKYYGMRLSVDDEDLLLVCLYLAEKHKSKSFLTTFTGLQKLLKIIPNQKYNQRFKDAFERLGVASFSIQYKGKDDQWSVGHIMSVKGHKRKLLITFDDDFYSEFLKSYTLLSIPFRMKLKGDLAKLLFVFLSSHRTPVSYFTNTLAEALNMNPNGDKNKKYLSRKLRDAFRELQDKGFLIQYAYDSKKDIFTLKPIRKKEWKKLK